MLDLDLDESLSNQGRLDSSRTNSPVPNEITSGPTIASTTSSPQEVTPPPVKKRGRPKGTYKKARPALGLGTTREPRVASAKESKEVLIEILDKKPMEPTPPQLIDNNSSSSSATSSRPIRNRTKPKDKDFLWDLSSLKEDFIYEDDAMDTALSESILSASMGPNNFTGAMSGGDSSDSGKSSNKRTSNGTEHRKSSDMDTNGDEQLHGNGGGQKQRTLSRDPWMNNLSNGQDNGTVDGSFKSKLNSKINWDKNVIIPTRVVEHRHSVDRARGLAQAEVVRKGEMRRNSIEIMTKTNVKENNRPTNVAPLSMIGNIMEPMARAKVQQQQQLQHQQHQLLESRLENMKDLASIIEERALIPDSHSPPGDHHVLLNGRSLGEILSMNTKQLEAAVMDRRE